MNFKTMSEIYLGSLSIKLRERVDPVYCHFAQGLKASKALAAIPGILAYNNIIAYNGTTHHYRTQKSAYRGQL